MNLTFIRHAKSENYDANKRQGPDSKLGKTGKKQAVKIANRLKKILTASPKSYDLIMTSPWTRAVETSAIISNKTGLPVTEHPLIHEYASNPILSNQSLDSEIVKEFNQAVKNGVDFEWRFRGEGENMRDIINRAIAFKKELVSSHLGKNYIVVSHGLFITSLLTVLILGENYSDADFRRISEMIRLENTSITNISFDESDQTWQIKHINDHSHLEK